MRFHHTLLTATYLILLTLSGLQTPPTLHSTQTEPTESALSETHLTVAPPVREAPAFQSGPPLLTSGQLESLEAGSTRLALPPTPSAGTPVPLGVPSVEAVGLQVAPESSSDFGVFANVTVQLPNGAPKSLVDEPSVAQKNQTVFYTGNWYAARSLNGGSTWSYLDVFNDMPDFCCDQDTLYNPSRGIFLWYRMGKNDTTGTNRFYLGVSLNATSWWFYSVHPADVNPTWTGQLFDFPVLAYSDNFLYITTNLFKSGFYQNSLILRLSLDKLKNDQSISGSPYFFTPNEGFAPVQGAKQTMYFATHVNTGRLRLYVWNEGSSSLSFTTDITHPLFTATTPGLASCPAPDGGDICKRLDDRVLGGWIAKGVIGFLWIVAQGGSFAEPYTYFMRINETTKKLINTPALTSQSYASVYTSIAPNGRGDLGLAFFTAGSTTFPTLNVGIVDNITGNPPPWQFYRVATSTNGPKLSCVNGSSNPCWGDFIRVRAYNGTGNAWVAAGYTLQGGRDGTSVEPRYIVFGRLNDNPFNYTTVTFLTVPSVVGSITFNGTTFTNGQSGIYYFRNYSAFANIPANHTFSRWNATGGLIVSNLTANPTNITLVGPGILTAVFIPPNVTITFDTNPSSAGTITCSGETFNNGQRGLLPANSTIPCTANLLGGYRFVSWVGLATGTSRTLNLFTHNGGTLTANFGPATLTLSPLGILTTNLLLIAILWGERRKRKVHSFTDPSSGCLDSKT